MEIFNTRVMIEMKKEEAEALYKSGINNDCPSKYYNPARKIWWSIPDPKGRLPYTLCQECYHSNRFGEYNSKDITTFKESLVPMLINGIPCNCDGTTQTQGFPINFENGWTLGIYTVQPTISIIKTDTTYIDGRVCIDAPLENYDNDDECELALNFSTDSFTTPNDVVCEIEDGNKKFSTLVRCTMSQEGYYNFNITGSANTVAKYYKFRFGKNFNDKLTVKMYSRLDEVSGANDYNCPDSDDDNYGDLIFKEDTSNKKINFQNINVLNLDSIDTGKAIVEKKEKPTGHKLLFEFDLYPRHVSNPSVIHKGVSSDNDFNLQSVAI